MDFRVIGEISEVETIAEGRAIRVLPRLEGRFGRGRWRKLKGVCLVELPNGSVRRAEVHWYEAHGIGRRYLKVKRLLS